MKKILLISIVFLTLTGCISKHVDQDGLSCIQIVDRNGISETISTKERLEKFENSDFMSPQPYKQVVRIYPKNQKNHSPSIITTYHPNGFLRQYLEVLDSRAYGTYKEWHTNGQIKVEAKIIGGPADLHISSQSSWIFDGLCRAWDEQGHLLSEITYDKGNLEGQSIYYFSSGKIQKIIPYRNNQIHGEVKKYHENGEISHIAHYKLDNKQGQSHGFSEDGQCLFFETYENEKLVQGEYYNCKKELISQISQGNGYQALYQEDKLFKLIQFQNGIPHGKVQVFQDGQLSQIYHQKNEKKQGDETTFYLQHELENDLTINQPQPKLSLEWNDCSIHGTVKTWYNNGKLENQKEIVRNQKNGMSLGWYKNESLMFIEEYENDHLIRGTYYKKNQEDPVSRIENGNGIATLYDGDGSFLRKIKYLKGVAQEKS